MREIELTVMARDVEVGDRILNKSAFRPEHRWPTVMGTRIAWAAHRVVLITASWEAWKHPDEGVTIRRLERHGL